MAGPLESFKGAFGTSTARHKVELFQGHRKKEGTSRDYEDVVTADATWALSRTTPYYPTPQRCSISVFFLILSYRYY